MSSVTIRARELQIVRQAAKDKREKNVTVRISHGCVLFTIGQNGGTITLIGRENGNGK